MVSDQILEGRYGHIVIQEREVILLSLSELESNWGWVIGDKVLES